MRLRHKKPINSYVGQATYDNNDAQDEDFIRASVSCKKNQIYGQRTSCEKTRKYAEYLCDFINSINQNYRNHVKKNQVSDRQYLGKKDSKDSREALSGAQNARGNICEKSQEVVSKQQQKIQNVLNLMGKNNLLTKKIKKQKIRSSELNKNIQIKGPNLNLKSSQNGKKTVTLKTIAVDPSPNTEKPLPKPQQPVSQPLPPIQQRNPKQNYQIPAPVLDEQLQKLLFLQQQLLQNPLYAANNPALYSMFPYSYAPMLNYQLYMEQMKANPFFGMGNPMGMFPNNLINNCIPFSKLPFATAQEQKRSQKSIEKKQSQPQSQPVPKKLQSNPTEIPKPAQQRPVQLNQSIHFKSKSCYHIGIAYNIHFANLKEKGCLNFNSAVDYQKIDPTYPAKRARQRKNSDNLTNVNPPSYAQH